MTLGQHISLLRKNKKYSQSELGKKVGTSGDIIGRYERDEVNPSVEVIVKIADALEISIDYLVGKTSLAIDKDTLRRIEEIINLPSDEKKYIFRVLDSLIRDYKTHQTYAH